MHPTVEEQLAAIRRLVEEAAADPAIGSGAAGALSLAAGQLRRLERSAGARLPFLLADNERTAALLRELASEVPRLEPLAVRAGAPRPGADEPPSEPLAHRRNKELRALLADAVHELGDGDDPPTAAARAAIAAHLRARLAADPALNRKPTLQPNPETPTWSSTNRPV